MRLYILLLLFYTILVQASWNTYDIASLQRGARLYMNYCSGCHALQYMRYNRMAKDLGLTTLDGHVDTDLLKNNLIFTTAQVHDPIRISMPSVEARTWFGVIPPDLSLIARSRDPAWLSAFLNGFYEDLKRPFGVNNIVFKDVAMPDVLYPLRGRVVLKGSHELIHVEAGWNEHVFSQHVQDLVYFLVYVGEPIQWTRRAMGWKVCAFLFVFLGFVYALKRLYWKQVDAFRE